jgi:hypothetical protein
MYAEYQSIGERPFGRPERRWDDNINADSSILCRELWEVGWSS